MLTLGERLRTLSAELYLCLWADSESVGRPRAAERERDEQDSAPEHRPSRSERLAGVALHATDGTPARAELSAAVWSAPAPMLPLPQLRRIAEVGEVPGEKGLTALEDEIAERLSGR